MDLMQSLIASKLLGGGGGSEPVLKTKTIYENGTYSATEDEADGYSNVTVDVPKNVTSRGLTVNGTFSSAVDNKDGYSNVTVNVQEAPVKTTSLSVTENGTYEPGPASEVSLTIPTIPDEVETDVSAGSAITNFDNLRVEFTNKTTGATGHIDIYPSAIAIQQIPMSFKDRTLIMGPDGDHYITLVNGYDSIVVLQKGYTITAMKLTSYSGYFDEVNVNVEGGGGDIYKYLWSSDEKICIREGVGEIKWFFNGYITDSGEDLCPQEFEQFIPSGALQGGVILGSAYSTSAATEQVGWIGFYQNKIRVWSIDKGSLITGTFYGVVDALDSSAEQHEVYKDPLDIPDIDISVIEKTITENGTYSAEDDGYVGYSDVIVDVPLPQNAYLLKSVANLPQAIATFTDGADAPMKSLKVAIEPQQDLHGYDSPWVGGAGKNKLNLSTRASATVQGITSEVKADNTIVASGTSTGNGDIICPVETPFTMANGETYTISINGTDIRARQFTIFIGTSYRNVGVIPAIEHSLTFTVTSELVCNQVMLRTSVNATVNINAKVQIEKGSTATSYASYSNICPISGWDEVYVTVADDVETPTVSNIYTIDLDGTRYGGEVDVVNGIVTPAPYYASYNGETLTGEWISDRDKYEVGATPTIGAQVVNIGASGTPVSILPTAVKSLRGVNNVYANTGDITDAEYFSKEM